MNSSDKINSKKELLKSFDVFSGLKNQTLDRLAEISEEIELTQGQTLIRSGTIETHCFLLLEGALRLLATDPFRSELFTWKARKLEVWWCSRFTKTRTVGSNDCPKKISSA